MNKKKFLEMVAAKNTLEKKLKNLQEHRRRDSLSYLIESDLDKLTLALTAQDMVDKIGKMAEDVIKMEANDLMPMADPLRSAYGPQMAEKFSKAFSDQIRSTTEMLTNVKNSMSNEIARLKGETNDMDMAEPEVKDDADLGMDSEKDPFDALDDEAPAEKKTVEKHSGESDLFNDDEINAAGRPRKESRQRRGKPLNESLLDSLKTVLTARFDDVSVHSPREQLEALKPFITASDYEIASQFPDQLLAKIFDKSDSAERPVATATVDSEMNMDGDYDDLDTGMDELELEDDIHDHDSSAELEGMHDDMHDEIDRIGSMATLPQLAGVSMPFESRSAIAKLRESKNPDAAIYGMFKKIIKEGIRPVKAAKRLAETFAIDYSDIVRVLKESNEQQGAGRDWNKLYKEAKEEKLTVTNTVNFIIDNTSDVRYKTGHKKCMNRKDYENLVKNWVKEKNNEKLDEDKKVSLDRHLQRKLNASKDKSGKVDPAKNPYGQQGIKVNEAKEKPYHVVLISDDGGQWKIHFGDYDKKVAKQELEDCKYDARSKKTKEKYKLITVATDNQKAIDKEVADLNKSTVNESGLPDKFKFPADVAPKVAPVMVKNSEKRDSQGTSPVVGKQINSPVKADNSNKTISPLVKDTYTDGAKSAVPKFKNRPAGKPSNPAMMTKSGKDPQGKSPVVESQEDNIKVYAQSRSFEGASNMIDQLVRKGVFKNDKEADVVHYKKIPGANNEKGSWCVIKAGLIEEDLQPTQNNAVAPRPTGPQAAVPVTPNATVSKPTTTPKTNAPASPEDINKAKQLATKIQQTPNFDPNNLQNEVQKNIASVGKGPNDVQSMTDLVKAQMGLGEGRSFKSKGL